MLLRNTLYNLLGLGLPLVVAVFSIPQLISHLGADRFGLLTLIWAVVSYFGLFDLGLGRALTQRLAVVFAQEDHRQAGPLIGTSTVLMAALGIVAGLLMAAAAPWGVSLIKDVPDRQEAINAVYAMALAMPAIVLTSGFRGILEARHAFGVINLIRLPMGLFTFLGPLVVVIAWQPRLDAVAWILCAGRVVACIVHAWYSWRSLPDDHGNLEVRHELLKPLCVSGGWLTASNIISPFMGYVDRFVIGAVVSASAVAYYVTPNELVTKLWIIPGALTTVLFPTFAPQMASRDGKSWALFGKAVHWVYLAILPASLLMALFAREILLIWVGKNFADQSSVLLQIFAIGIFINCLAHIPFTLIQSADRPHVTALVHGAELPLFIVLLWCLTSVHGLVGAALAWLIRMSLDTVLMFILCARVLDRSPLQLLSTKTWAFGLIAGCAYGGILIESFNLRIIWVMIVVGIIFQPIVIRKIRPPLSSA